ncbi:MAG: hypothetical protein GWM92_09355 [Gemmatimonadetes bacterium]|nr:PhzF family phenazine biosynthesis protein [Gemmatimonadota bacterium]NIR78863.1 PhzF family phenazine biosynthesis protein [Gemmatimonadota bacterium]NIT87502.1 PhzF family phenazine biosynthesis protein [Gemmatimonadota bacterium]NIU31371.1 PhzF family phenazine biosynthesis protein [Gemmatimonadota bacterium]NIU36048.1 hypothetical protein [Gemmatimonadota bacterium]
MSRRPFYWVDAFTADPLRRNPCAVVLDSEGIDPETMKRIAPEMNLSETALVFSSEVADFGAPTSPRPRRFPWEGSTPSDGRTWMSRGIGR